VSFLGAIIVEYDLFSSVNGLRQDGTMIRREMTEVARFEEEQGEVSRRVNERSRPLLGESHEQPAFWN
jgi:hypothetical protein